MIRLAMEIAENAHRCQTDKGGAPYIEHVLRVSAAAAEHGEAAQTVALLHDVVEDSSWTLAGLTAAGFPGEIVAAVDALTRRKGESYADFIERVAADPLARVIKAADLRDNMNLDRIAVVTPEDHRRWRKYERALKRLETLETDSKQA